MCSSKSKLVQGSSAVDHINMNGRSVLQPTCNVRVHLLDHRNSLKKVNSPPKSPTTTLLLQPLSSTQKLKSPRPTAVKRGSDRNGLNSSVDKVLTPSKSVAPVKKSKKCGVSGIVARNLAVEAASCSLKFASSGIVEEPGSIAAARREQVAIMQIQRKLKISHYGRTNSGKYHLVKEAPLHSSPAVVHEEKRCSFITSNSDPIYVAYHDQEWGVPVHDDNLLFELLVLTGAQVGSDWISILKKRRGFRDAFSGFDPETVSKFSEKNISSISADYDIEISQIRGVVDNANRILEIKKEFRSFDKYLWGFVNHKPIGTQYKSCHKMPVKTSKSECISKDMVRRGFRLVGPTVIHSFMQSAGLTNDHLTTCPRHLQCLALSQIPNAAPALKRQSTT